MNSKTKSALVLLGTLMLGIAIGAMLWTAVHNKQMAEIRSLRTRGALPRVIESVVEPIDAEQRENVRAVVSRYEDGLSEIYREMARARTSATDSLRLYLGEFLNESQIARLDDWLRERRRSPRSSSARSDSVKTETR
jgi:hypothetical protein